MLRTGNGLGRTMTIFESEYFDDPEPARRRDYRIGKHRSNSSKEFIAFDGEGLQTGMQPVKLGPGIWMGVDEEIFLGYKPKPQPYVLLANSKGDRIIDQDGLSTFACLEFLLDTKKQYPNSIFVGFSIGYDINEMLKDLDEKHLLQLHEHNVVRWGGYRIEWRPRKWLTVTHRKSGRSARLYDVFGFFQRAFLDAVKDYLGVDEPGLQLIEKGKQSRNTFNWDELDFIIEYNDLELELLVKMMNVLRSDLNDVGIVPTSWHGPGAIAHQLFKQMKVPIPTDIPEEVLDAAQFAYAGGRFEQFKLGRYSGTVYEYDIRSAYPSAATRLPDLTRGHWEHVNEYDAEAFGVWFVDYCSKHGDKDNRPQPLFCRSDNGFISYPREVSGWYWAPEARLVSDCVTEGYVFRSDSEARPFAFLEELYERRREYKRQGKSSERALKLVLNSVYGKLAQTVGGKEGPPTWHCLAYAGYITSFTRAKIFDAVQQAPDKIIAIETDAVFSTVPLDLPESPMLGDWECIELDNIMYLQSGFYYANDGVICKYRGMDKNKLTGHPVGLPYSDVVTHLYENHKHVLHTLTTRFVGLGMSLQTNAVWRSWETAQRAVNFNGQVDTSKRYHNPNNCDLCLVGVSPGQTLHPMKIGGYSGPSYARVLPWRMFNDAFDMSFDDIVLVMKDDIPSYEFGVDAWQ